MSLISNDTKLNPSFKLHNMKREIGNYKLKHQEIKKLLID